MTETMENLRTLDPHQIVDRFLSEVLLPSTEYSHPSRDLYDIFLQYCGALELAPPSIQLFSRHFRTRLQSRRVHGTLEFYCIVKPELLDSSQKKRAENGKKVKKRKKRSKKVSTKERGSGTSAASRCD